MRRRLKRGSKGSVDLERAKLAVEAMVFSSDKPVEASKLMEAAGLESKSQLAEVVEELNKEYAAGGHVFVISRFPGDKYLMHLRQQYLSLVRMNVGRSLLSQALLRTLSFIAYHQPVQRSTVAAVRGGRAYRHINALMERGLIQAEKRGRTLMLRTTKLFADYLGVEDSPSAIRKKIQEAMENLQEGR